LSEMPPFDVLNGVQDLKPGASLIANVRDSSGTVYPAIAVQRFGAGRAAAVLIGDVWRWGFRDPNTHADMDKAWRQLIRWLVADIPERVELTVNRSVGSEDQPATLRVRVRGPEFEP